MEPIMYECGISVYRKVAGYEPSTKDYVCVLDNAGELNAEQAFTRLLEILREKQIKIKQRFTYHVIAENDDTYTFANERTYDNKGVVTITPSNILRHVFSRDFTIESLYVDESGQTVDLTNQALNDINRQVLLVLSGIEFRTLYNRKVDFFIDAIYYKITQSLSFQGHLEEYIYSVVTNNFDKMDNSNPKIKELCENYAKQFIAFVNNTSNISRYFYNICGMKLIPSFGHDVEVEAKVKTTDKYIRAKPLTKMYVSSVVKTIAEDDVITGTPEVSNEIVNKETEPMAEEVPKLWQALAEIQQLNSDLQKLKMVVHKE